jgi:hypothetical protein
MAILYPLGMPVKAVRVDSGPAMDALADITLPNHDDEPVRLGDLWSDRPAALIWLRHYG